MALPLRGAFRGYSVPNFTLDVLRSLLNQDNQYARLLGGKRCLIVEDEFLIALDYERILESAGAQSVLSANSVSRAEEMLRRHGPVQLVLLDVNLNGESSLPLARALLQESVPVVIITGLAGRSALPADLGEVAVLEKPFEEQKLLETIAAAIRS